MRATAEVVHERGLMGLTVSRLIAAAGLSRATFYQCFQSKEECFDFSCQEAHDLVFTSVEAAYTEPGPWARRFRAALVELIAKLNEEPLLCGLCLTDAATMNQVARVGYERSLELVIKMLREGRIEEGVSESEALELGDEMVAAGILASLSRRLTGGKPNDSKRLSGDLLATAAMSYVEADGTTTAAPSLAVTAT